MGQYYRPIIKKENDIVSYANFVNGDYMLAKLMEHSWLYNPFVNGLAAIIYKNPCKVAWVGDYADATDPEIYKIAWGDEDNEAYARKDLTCDESFTMEHKFLVNHTSQEYIDIDKYIEKIDSEWVPHPLSILTACGNGQGGGDYFSEIHKDDVGSWKMNLISVEDNIDDIPKEYTESVVYFKG